MTAGATDRTAAAPSHGRARRAVRALVDAVLVAILVAAFVQIGFAATRLSRRSEQVEAVRADAKALYRAFRTYHERNGMYPDAHSDPPFNPATLEPLRRRGYYTGSIGNYILNGQLDAYDAPDDQGPNREFWLEMTLASDPSVRILVSRSDDAPLSGGLWTDGVFVVRDGKMERL